MKEQQQLKPIPQAKEFKIKFTEKIDPKIKYTVLPFPRQQVISLLDIKFAIAQRLKKEIDQFEVYELNEKGSFTKFASQDDIKDSLQKSCKFYVKILENSQRINTSQISIMTYADQNSNAIAIKNRQQERRISKLHTKSLADIKMDTSLIQQPKIQSKEEDIKVNEKDIKVNEEVIKVKEIINQDQMGIKEDQEIAKKQEYLNIDSLPQVSIISKDIGKKQTEIDSIAKETALFIQQILMSKKRQIGLKLSKKIVPNKQSKFDLKCNLCSDFPLYQTFYACQMNLTFISCKNCIQYQQYQLPYFKFLPFFDLKPYKELLKSQNSQQSLKNFNHKIKQQHRVRNNNLKNILKDIQMPKFTLTS